MRYRLVVWDFDGTLADTFTLALSTYNRLAARHGCMPVQDPETIRRLPTREFLRQHRVSLVRLPLLIRDYLAEQRKWVDQVRLAPGVADTTARLRSAGVRLGILSSNTKDTILACLTANGLADTFEFVVGYPRLLGKARAMRRILRQQAVAPSEFLYVGDEVRDLEAAREAGVDVAAALWGFQSPEILERERPTHLLRQPTDLLGLVL
jgi:phosphoglycolate phosphatase